MKWDFAIGNPPYQDDRQGTSTTALPVYHEFINAAYELGNAVELIHPARFLFNAGRTPKDWNAKMLNDDHLKILDYQQDAKSVFPNTDIKGGVVISYHDSGKSFGKIGTFTVFEELNMILKKLNVMSTEYESLAKIAFVASKFNTETLFSDYPEVLGRERRMSSNVLQLECFHDSPSKDDITIYGIYNGKRAKRYISSRYVDLTDSHIGTYKVVIPKADGNGGFGDTLTKPEVLGRQAGFTHTFLGIGTFASEIEAVAALKYIKSKFARCLLSVLKITQDMNADKWRYVPLQDFTENSDINWNTSIANIDKQLYKKYGLSQEEIGFIETHVKEMA